MAALNSFSIESEQINNYGECISAILIVSMFAEGEENCFVRDNVSGKEIVVVK